MSEFLTSGDVAQLGLLQAVTSDPETRRRVNALLDAQAAIDASTAELQQKESTLRALVTEAQARTVALDKREAALDTEKREFGKVREAVESAHKARTAELAKMAADLAKREEALAQSKVDAAAVADQNTAMTKPE
jgi:chromosome segregation ATPase